MKSKLLYYTKYYCLISISIALLFLSYNINSIYSTLSSGTNSELKDLDLAYLVARYQASVLDDEKQYDEAISSYKKIIEDYPDDINSWILIGRNYYLLKQYDQALSYLDEATKLNASSYDAWFIR